ncbi:MAG TPA: DMT family transporter, partial [Leptolinea sp.]
SIKELQGRDWLALAGLGMLSYPLSQGGFYLALSYLPNTTVSLLLNFSPIFIALLGGLWLDEKLNRWQFLGMAISIAGAVVFFLPLENAHLSGLGLLFAGIALLANVFSSIYARKVLRGGTYPVMVITGVCMGIGATVLVGGSAAWEWIPRISIQVWGMLILLALINTALAFTMWNSSLQRLTAIEANIINNTMLVQIALESWIFLGDIITLKMVIGMLLVMGGAVLVNLRGSR